MIVSLLAWAVSATSCMAPTPLDSFLKPRHVVSLGEVHGTDEAPQHALALACRAAALKLPTWLGLEMPHEEQALVDAFLRTGDYGPLLAAPFWRRAAAAQDGRSSLAMLGLLGRIRELDAEGIRIRVFLFDAENPGIDRNRDMAGEIQRLRQQNPEGSFILLTGDLHARIRKALPRSLSWHLAQADGGRVHAILLAHGAGTMWGCQSPSVPCGVTSLPATTELPEGAFRAYSPRRDGFDAEWSIGPVKASPPAAGGVTVAAPIAQSVFDASSLSLKTTAQRPIDLEALRTRYVLVLPWSTLCGGPHVEVLRRAELLRHALRADRRVAVLVLNLDPIDNPADAEALRHLIARNASDVTVWLDRQTTLIRRMDMAMRARRPQDTFPENAVAIFDVGLADRHGDVLFVESIGRVRDDKAFVAQVRRTLSQRLRSTPATDAGLGRR